MKRISLLLSAIIKQFNLSKIIICCLSCSIANAGERFVNVYNWSNYMPPQVLAQFQRETGIHVNYSEFDSSETLYAKLKTNPHSGFDIIVPGSYYIPRMAREHLLHNLDKSKLPNLRYLNPELMNRKCDPDNQYSVPYTWGITGIAINTRYHNINDITRWKNLWRKSYRNQLLMMDDMREVFSIALISLGYSVNETNIDHIKAAYQKLRQLMPNIKLFNSDAAQNIYVDEDATLGMAWNGGAFQVQKENPSIKFIYPKGRFVLWIDTLAIPKNAPHLDNAYRFINFINRPDIAAKIAIYNGYSSPNLAALKQLPEELRNNPTFNPPQSVLKRAVMEEDLGEANVIYEKYWQQLKMGS